MTHSHQDRVDHGHRHGGGHGQHDDHGNHHELSGHGHQHGDTEALAALLDLDEETFAGYLDEVVGWISTQATTPVTTVLDLGAGTGSGTLALARRIPAATVTAVDAQESYLARILQKAAAQGLTDRVATRQVDLDEGPLDFPATDLAWASLSMHHFADPGAVLDAVHRAVRPGGLLVVVEMDTHPRMLPDDLGAGRPGLETRLYERVKIAHQAELPDLGADWGPKLERAGFVDVVQRDFALDPARPYPPAVAGFAFGWLQRMAERFGPELDADDQAVLATLLDGGPADVRHRDDLAVHGTRQVWLGRRA